MTNSKEWNVLLHDGTEIDARWATNVLTLLHEWAETNPQVVLELQDYVEGKIATPSEQAMDHFNLNAPIGKDFIAVMKNAGAITNGKQVFVGDPFVHTERCDEIIRAVLENRSRNVARLLGRDDDPGRSR